MEDRADMIAPIVRTQIAEIRCVVIFQQVVVWFHVVDNGFHLVPFFYQLQPAIIEMIPMRSSPIL